MNAIKAIQNNSFYNSVKNWALKRELTAQFIVSQWQRNGKPNPPPHVVKQRALRDHANTYGLRILVETGTYLGDMVEAMKSEFDKIYSIELSEALYEQARLRFKNADNIEIIHGDSGIVLGRLVGEINQPALFWLDGHYSGGLTAKGEKETPIYKEIQHILNAPDAKHVIIIDDARCFGELPDYPSIEELQQYVWSKNPDLSIVIQDDSIRITPPHEAKTIS